jgi:4-amino-4-deoxy-L-arabinose transferase-like glycosyltransferase
MRDRWSVAVGDRGWRGGFLIAFFILQAIKLGVAATLSPFGDEAFYWQESLRPAWGYSDLPPLTAWLVRLGEAVAGHGLLGMRWPFLLIGAALPWLVVAFARRAFDARAGWQAGLLCLALPLAGSLGVLALPDVPLTFAIMLALYALIRALDEQRTWQWALLGAALAIAWTTHYRAAMPMLAGLLLFVLTPRGRAQWRRPGFWLAMLIAMLGLIPLLVFNLAQRGVGIGFQLVERNPWAFHVDALVQPLEQALTCTPLLYGLLLWAAWRSWRRRDEPSWDVMAVVAATFLLAYFFFGLFADDLRFRVHWPLPGYLPLLAALPVLLREEAWRRRWPRRFLVVAFALAGAVQLLGMGYLALAASRDGVTMLADVKAFPSNFVGWRESGVEARRLLGGDRVLVADNFMLAAELDFQLGGTVPVYALDNPLNTKHGRAPQLAIWRLDEPALRAAYSGQTVLLAVEETALRERERQSWLSSICTRVESPQPLSRLNLFGGRKRIAFYRIRVPSAVSGSGGDCVFWQAYIAAREPLIYSAQASPLL